MGLVKGTKAQVSLVTPLHTCIQRLQVFQQRTARQQEDIFIRNFFAVYPFKNVEKCIINTISRIINTHAGKVKWVKQYILKKLTKLSSCLPFSMQCAAGTQLSHCLTGKKVFLSCAFVEQLYKLHSENKCKDVASNELPVLIS